MEHPSHLRIYRSTRASVLRHSRRVLPELRDANEKGEKSISIRPRLVVNTAEAAVDAATAGVGLAHVLSYQAWPAYQEGKLKLLLRQFDPNPVPVSMVHTGQGPLPAKTRRFVDCADPRLRKTLEKLTRGNPPGLAKDAKAAAHA